MTLGDHQPEETPPRALAGYEKLVALAKLLGMSPPAAERLLDFWKAFGFTKALAISMAMAFPLFKFVWLPAAASAGVAALAEGYGIELTVGDWTADLMDLRVTGQDVTIRTTGQYARDEAFHADEMALDLSLVRRLRTGHWIDDITLRGPSLYLERLISGRWNVADMIEAPAPPTGPASDTVGLMRLLPWLVSAPEQLALRLLDTILPSPGDSASFTIPRLRMENLRIEWVENLPGASGSGLIQSSKASLFIDNVRLLAQDMAGPVDGRDEPSRFSIEGRTADGVISIEGSANLFHWSPPPTGSTGPEIRVVAATDAQTAWNPRVRARIYLENVGTAALGRMVPAFLVPVSGTMTGWIEIALRERRVECRSELELRNVAYATNNAVLGPAGPSPELTQSLTGFRASGKVSAPCEAAGTEETYHPVQSWQVALTREAVRDAPPIVQQAAAFDEERLTGRAAVEQAYDAITRETSRQLIGKAAAGLIGSEKGDALARSLTGTTDTAQAEGQEPGERQGVNPVAKGLKSIGSGFKRLFGGGKNRQP